MDTGAVDGPSGALSDGFAWRHYRDGKHGDENRLGRDRGKSEQTHG
jgi:hypothetical protein